jgi:ABC-type nitrate/sulfonate/bicarbonate transport system substrate-binding protein
MVGPSNSLVAQSGIKSYADLPKDEVLLGISNQTAGSTISSLLLLKKAGIPPDRVTLISVGGSSARFAAVVAKKVHVAPAVLSVALRAPFEGLNILGHAPDAVYPTIFISHSINNDWVNQSEENFDLAVRNTTATLRGLHWGFSNKEGMMKWLVDFAKVPSKAAEKYYRIGFESDRPLFSSDGKLLEKAWINTFDTLEFAGQLKKPFPKISDLSRTDIYEAAIKRLKQRYNIELSPSKAERI